MRRDDAASLRPVAIRLAELLDAEVGFANDCVGPAVHAHVEDLADGDVLLLENVRFHKAETENEPAVIRDAREEFTAFRTDPSMNPDGVHIADSEVQVMAAPGFAARPTEILWATDAELKVWPGLIT